MPKLETIRQQLPPEALLKLPTLPFPHLGSGKVREIFDLGPHLLIVATDRLSAFDVVLPDGIPGKGIILTQLSLWWFEKIASAGAARHHLVPNHREALAAALPDHPELVSRSMLVRKMTPLKIEAVVRGYLAGSAWSTYRDTGSLWGQPVPAGLPMAGALPRPYFTPTSKASAGHDLPMTLDQTRTLLGEDRFAEVTEQAIGLYQLGQQQANRAGLILADTKFEFGVDSDGQLHLIDEALTPDSSRYWATSNYQPGRPQEAFDKQFIRDHLASSGWDQQAPGPRIPRRVIQQTLDKYWEALEKLLGS